MMNKINILILALLYTSSLWADVVGSAFIPINITEVHDTRVRVSFQVGPYEWDWGFPSEHHQYEVGEVYEAKIRIIDYDDTSSFNQLPKFQIFFKEYDSSVIVNLEQFEHMCDVYGYRWYDFKTQSSFPIALLVALAILIVLSNTIHIFKFLVELPYITSKAYSNFRVERIKSKKKKFISSLRYITKENAIKLYNAGKLVKRDFIYLTDDVCEYLELYGELNE
jgi:hypothetical protein